jgi:hypothetical protein
MEIPDEISVFPNPSTIHVLNINSSDNILYNVYI